MTRQRAPQRHYPNCLSGEVAADPPWQFAAAWHRNLTVFVMFMEVVVQASEWEELGARVME